MATPADILSNPWSTLNLLPESIPHLLHWDLAYLWVLGRKPEVRPANWRVRAEAWRKLLGHLLLGNLKLETQVIREPLAEYTRQYGIEQVTKLYLNGKLVGVTSPVVLVRPLPDATDEELKALPALPFV